MDERRSAHRARVLKSGKIITSDKAPPIVCTVRNMSDAGALLVIDSSTFGIPGEFELVIGGQPHRACRAVWRDLKSIGVEFV